MHAGPAGEHLGRGDAARGRVARVDGIDVAADLSGDAAQRADADHGPYDSPRAGADPPRVAGVRGRATGSAGWRAASAPPATTSSSPSSRTATCRAPTAGAPSSAPSSGASPPAATTSASSSPTRSAACCGCARRPRWPSRAASIASSSWPRPCPGAQIEELAGFYPTGAEREAVAAAARHTRLVCSDDDPYCPGGAAQVWGEPARPRRRPRARRRAPQRRRGLRPVARDGGLVPGHPRLPGAGGSLRGSEEGRGDVALARVGQHGHDPLARATRGAGPPAAPRAAPRRTRCPRGSPRARRRGARRRSPPRRTRR